MEIEVSPEQLEKQQTSKKVTEEGMVIEVKPRQFSKQLGPK